MTTGKSLTTVSSASRRELRPHPLGLFHGHFRDPEGSALSEGWYFTVTQPPRQQAILVRRPHRRYHPSAGYRISPFEVETLIEHPRFLNRR